MKYKLIMQCSIGFAIFLLGLYVGHFNQLHISNQPEDWGNFGSFFGGTIGSAITLWAIYIAFITFKNQKEQFRKQSFENNFFQLLTLFSSKVSLLELKGERGEAVYDLILKEFETKTTSYLNIESKTLYTTLAKQLIEKTYKNEFSILLNHLYSCSTFIKQNAITDKKMYLEVLYLQFSVSQISLMNKIAIFDIKTYNILLEFPNSENITKSIHKFHSR